ncbi:D-fructose-6-phosphate amidotransferase [Vibrio sp. 99-8-1]|nr:D-fructose-6-phosphate amidotransferase [Vibrio sp. 99-8-1]
MMKRKIFIRDMLGLVLIVSIVMVGLGILLDVLAIFAYFDHEEMIMRLFFHESLYLFVFLIPPYFIAKYINTSELIAAINEYRLMKNRSER